MVAMLHNLTGGRWGFVTRRFLESAFGTLPMMALLFIPLFFGLRQLYPWAHPELVSTSEVLRNKHLYMSPALYCVRTAVFFGIWIWIATSLRRSSLRQDETEDPEPTRRMRRLSGPGIVIYAVTATFAYVDWVMSLEADWYSTMFAVLVIIGQMLSAFAFMILLLAFFGKDEPLATILTGAHFHHLSNLLLAFVMMWTYMAFSQLLIIWSGNLPHEIGWYIHRSAGTWRWIVVLLALFHFAVPFFLLLFRQIKRKLPFLTAIAATVFAMHLVDVFWLVAPSFYHGGITITWLNIVAPVGIGGLWLAAFGFYLKRAEFLPRNDPRFREVAIHAA
jgi:hypothetical protein